MCWFDPLSPYTSILVFDINTENLCSEALPPKAQNLSVPKLVAKGGEDLCCCYVRYAETVVGVWVLVDYTDLLWERKNAVNFDWEKNRCPSEAWSAHAPLVTRVTKVVSIQDNLLVLGFGGGELRCYDLESNASWIVDTSKFDGKKRTTWYGRRVDKDERRYGLVGVNN
ncbi:Unknown protein [Striga hermonthica]|uniref:F-box protein n=1 Tax=Striga hermonthica TaxID=68872 RepID=A0A9N7MQA7_STRHE|nr:Unknown protein [Striga hermonthica]